MYTQIHILELPHACRRDKLAISVIVGIVFFLPRRVAIHWSSGPAFGLNIEMHVRTSKTAAQQLSRAVVKRVP